MGRLAGDLPKAFFRAKREADRAEKRRKRELETLNRIEKAKAEVEEYNNYICKLISFHTDILQERKWHILHAKPPIKPLNLKERELHAISRLNTYKPSLLDKLLKRTQQKHNNLHSEVHEGRIKDEQDYDTRLSKFINKYTHWLKSHDFYEKATNKDCTILEDICNSQFPYGKFKKYINSINFDTDNSRCIETNVQIKRDADIIPQYEKKVLTSGNLSTKRMSKTRFFSLYYAFVWTCICAVAHSLLALLPIDIVIINVSDEIRNAHNAYENNSLVSVVIDRTIFYALDLSNGDSITNLIKGTNHRVEFLKTKGFKRIQSLKSSELKLVDYPQLFDYIK